MNEELRLNTSLVKRKKLKSGETKVTISKKDVADKYNAYSKEYLRRFTREHPSYFEKFKLQAKSELSSLTNEEILEDHSNELYFDIIDRLINEFSEIKLGASEANKFHDHIIACMNFLFYPNLTNPVKEQEIHQGRKRIDLAYNNASQEGFFYNLQTVKDIPSAFLCVECKNYTKDVTNPELDQLNGRFSANRGKVGFMVFRSCQKESVLIQRCTDYYNDNKNLILPMQDKDFIDILSKLKENTFDRSNQPQEIFLQKLTQRIIMN